MGEGWIGCQRTGGAGMEVVVVVVAVVVVAEEQTVVFH